MTKTGERNTDIAKFYKVLDTQISKDKTATEMMRLKIPTDTYEPYAPSIYSITFPSEIPGNKTTIKGELGFRDNNGNVNRLTIEVVRATSFGGADYNPLDNIISGDEFNGVIQLFVWCDGAQKVTLRATLYDDTGLKSNSRDFSFRCTGN